MPSETDAPATEAAPPSFTPTLPPRADGPPRPSLPGPPGTPLTDPPIGAPVNRVPQPTVQNDALVKALQLAALQSSKQPQQAKKPHWRRRRFTFWQWMMWRAVIGVVLTGLFAGGTAINRWYQGHQRSSDRYPAAWDERVVEFANFVESERELRFEHPIYVEFFTEDEFVKLFEPGDNGDFEGGDGADTETSAASDLVDAAGLSATYEPGVDDSTVSQVTTLGFYSPEVQRIALRGEVLTPAVKVVLVHELTHALQDQNYSLQTGGANDMEVRAVVEADAMRIEDAYLATLSTGDRDDAIEDNSANESTDAALASVPWPMIDQSQAPYILGPIFLQHIIETGDPNDLAHIFEVPPTSEELVDPPTYPQAVTPSPGVGLPPGAVQIEPQRQWSKYDALIMLDAWLPWRVSRDALEGWGGGSYISYRKDGEDGPVCFSVNLQLDTPEQAALFGAAVSSWALNAGSATVPDVRLDKVKFEACTRRAGAADPPVPAVMTSEALYLEAVVAKQIRGTFLANPWYSCVARALIDDPTFASLAWTDVLTPEKQTAIDQAGDAARWVCGPAPIG